MRKGQKKGQVDDVLLFFRSILGPRASKADRTFLLCKKCGNKYSTCAQNERAKSERWICGHCILSKQKTTETKEKMRAAAFVPEKLAENIRRNSGENNPYFGRKHDEKALSKMRGRIVPFEKRQEQSRRMADEISSGKRAAHPQGKRSWYISTKTGEKNHADSAYELKRMKFLDACVDVIFWTKNHGIILSWGNEQRRYIPDFIIHMSSGQKFLEEIKGWVRDANEFRQKCAAGTEYAEEHDMKFRVLFGDSLEII